MAWQRRAGKQSLQNKAAAGEHSRRTVCLAQASKNTTASSWPASQQNNSQQMTLAGLSQCSAGWWRECGGAGHSEGGLRPTYLSPSHLSPLPVTISTHSLNLEKANLAPTDFFVIFIFPFSSHYNSSPNPLYCHCSANLSCHLAYSQLLRSLPRGE